MKNNHLFFSILLLSINSFLAVNWPIKYKVGKIMSSKRAAIVIVVIWIYCLLVGFLPLIARNAVAYRLSYVTFQYLPAFLPIKVTQIRLSIFIKSLT